jgi:protein disulfide-isomerase
MRLGAAYARLNMLKRARRGDAVNTLPVSLARFTSSILREQTLKINFYLMPMKMLHALFLVFLAMAASAADNPYNETADAKLEIKQALTQAVTAKTPVIVVFGANWCGDCQMLDTAMKSGASAQLLSRDFQIVKVNVGQFDKNLDVAKSYGVPLEKGIPAVVIISTNNVVLYATRDGELADARKMGDSGIYEFFKRVTASTMAKK